MNDQPRHGEGPRSYHAYRNELFFFFFWGGGGDGGGFFGWGSNMGFVFVEGCLLENQDLFI